MAATRLCSVIGYIEKLVGGSRESRGTDRQLLEDFSTRRDEAAFTELVARHGPLVLRVCRRVLHHEQDAEDAFQATFLVLARCSESIRQGDALANWLHGVAYRTAMNAKRSTTRRRNQEARLREQTPSSAASPTWDDVQGILDEEIQKLPSSFRSAFVLCVLEGKTVAAAAAELECKEGTVSSRLTRARQRLQQQLARRGIELAALSAALCVAQGTTKAAVPHALAQAAVRAGVLVASSGTGAGVISPHVVLLATGVIKAMFLQKAKIACLLLLTLGLFATGAGVLTYKVFSVPGSASTDAVMPGAQARTDKLPVEQADDEPQAEPAKPVENTIEVTGRVLDPDGKPVAKARLYQPRWAKGATEWAKDEDVVPLGVTDAQGRFRVQLLRVSPLSRQLWQLLAIADGFGLNWVDLPKEEKTDEVTLRLVKDQLVRGRLVNTEGKPVVGVTLRIHGLQSPLADMLNWFRHDTGTKAGPPGLYTALNKVVRVSATDKDGRFEIAGLGTERLVIAEVQSETAVSDVFLIATREGFDPKPLSAELRREGRQPQWKLWYGPSFECVTLPTQSLEGTVREASSGKPIVGAEVTAQTPGVSSILKESVTDANGHYRLNGLIKTDEYLVSAWTEKTRPFLPCSVQVADNHSGLETIRCDVVLHRGVIITGRVMDKSTGKGIRSRVGCVVLPDNPLATKIPGANHDFEHRSTKTDDEGHFSLITVPGANVLLAKASVVMHNLVSDPINPYKRAEFDEADGKSVKVGETGRKGMRYFVRFGGGWTVLDYYNACKLVDLKEGAAPVTCDLAVDPGKTMTLQLEDPDGKPLTGVTASGFAAMPYSVAVLKTSTCPVLALHADQPRRLAFLHRERKLFGLVTVASDGKVPLTVRLAPTSVITGRILDGGGQPLADAKVHVDYSEASADEIVNELLDSRDDGLGPRTDKEGRFRIEAVFPSLKFSLSASNGRDYFVEKTRREPLKSEVALDLGDIHLKPQSP